MILPRHITLFGRLVDLANIDCGLFLFDLTVWADYLWVLSGLPFILGMPWWPCCCGGEIGEICNRCAAGTTPASVKITVPANTWTIDGCVADDCDNAEGDFVLDQVGDDASTTACAFSACIITCHDDQQHVFRFEILNGSLGFRNDFSVAGDCYTPFRTCTNFDAAWTNGDPCDEFDNHELPWSQNVSPQCDHCKSEVGKSVFVSNV